MYNVRNYLTDEVVAVVTREADARAMVMRRREGDPPLIYEQVKSKKEPE